jgi:hypothetical protein
MSDKDGKPRSKDIDQLTEDDATMLRRLVGTLLPEGTPLDAALLVSRLIANIGQRERLLGRLQERLDVEEHRRNLAENTVRSMRGTGYDFRHFQTAQLKKAVEGAKKAERRRVVRWLRTKPATDGHWLHEKLLADAIENGDHTKVTEE